MPNTKEMLSNNLLTPPQFLEFQSSLKQLWLTTAACLLLLVLELYLLFSDFSYTPWLKDESRPVIATYLKGIHEVRNKQAGTIAWHYPTDGDLLRSEDALLTLKNSTAQIEFKDNSEMTIEPESLVILEIVKDTKLLRPTRTKIVLNLKKGKLIRKKAGNIPISVITSEKNKEKKVHISDPKGDAIFKVEQSETGLNVVVQKGTVLIDGVKPVEKLQKATLQEEKIEIQNLETAAAKKEAEIIEEESPVAAPIQTPEPAPVLETIPTPEPAPTPTPEPIRVPVKIKKPQFLPPPKLKTPKIRIKKDSTSIFDFLDLFFPSAYAQDLSNEGTPLIIEMEWEPVPGAHQYRIQVARDSNFNEREVNKRVTKPKYDFKTLQTAKENKFYFRIASIAEDGTQGAFSEAEPFVLPALKKEEISQTKTDKKQEPVRISMKELVQATPPAEEKEKKKPPQKEPEAVKIDPLENKKHSLGLGFALTALKAPKTYRDNFFGRYKNSASYPKVSLYWYGYELSIIETINPAWLNTKANPKKIWLNGFIAYSNYRSSGTSNVIYSSALGKFIDVEEVAEYSIYRLGLGIRYRYDLQYSIQPHFSVLLGEDTYTMLKVADGIKTPRFISDGQETSLAGGVTVFFYNFEANKTFSELGGDFSFHKSSYSGNMYLISLKIQLNQYH